MARAQVQSFGAGAAQEVSPRCSFCGGPWHPATGCQYGERTRSCLRCTLYFWAWFWVHQRPRKGKPDF